MGLSRRGFIKKSFTLAAAGVAAPTIIPAEVLAAPGRPGANDRIGVAYIGAGRRANQLMQLPPAGRIVAAADFDRERARRVAAKCNCRAYQDYRQLLDAGDIDAVFVATPDHWHVLPSIHACQAGKDVYLEKPLSLTIREGRILVDTVPRSTSTYKTGSIASSRASGRSPTLKSATVRPSFAIWAISPAGSVADCSGTRSAKSSRGTTRRTAIWTGGEGSRTSCQNRFRAVRRNMRVPCVLFCGCGILPQFGGWKPPPLWLRPWTALGADNEQSTLATSKIPAGDGLLLLSIWPEA